MRDGSATSATTELATSRDPATRLETARNRYRDALAHACDSVLGPAAIGSLENAAASLVPGIHDEPAWPTLRATLIRAAAHGQDPNQLLTRALDRGPLETAADPVATLNWRINDLTVTPSPAIIPTRVADHPGWAAYLDARLELARSELAQQPSQLTNVHPLRPTTSPPARLPAPPSR